MNTHKLYIILRQDMASMTPGRCAAMASHATSVFEQRAEYESRISDEIGRSSNLNNAIKSWKNETKFNFGTVIVLAAPSKDDLGRIGLRYEELIRSDIKGDVALVADAVVDPEYVLRDGDTFHIVPDVMTGFYVFADEENATKIGLKELKLL